MRERGLNFVHLHVFGPDADMHDRITGTPGSFYGVTQAIRNLLDLGVEVLAEVPMTRENYRVLPGVVDTLAHAGCQRVHITHARPVFAEGRFFIESVVRLNTARAFLNQALARAVDAGMDVTTEGIPLCTLDPRFHGFARQDTRPGVRIVDDFTGTRRLDQVKKESRFLPSICGSCALREVCPGPWAIYQYLAGDEELIPY